MLPLLRALAGESGTLVDHATAYADLAGDELQRLGQSWTRRLGWLIAAGASALAALLLAGVALLLWAMLPAADPARLWLLWAVPALPAALAMLALVAARLSTQQPAFEELRGQLRQDLELVREGLAS